ncbi:asparaginase domain-containing protein [Moraxella nasibovis]|uniref:asparaginase domain-containing protein n=1 Tax=Moraxella nasibovis TaxID=2904120 RepID=UPI00240FB8EF|nr:asparaginase domain-containing protein [Moraxella nasibovis]WFF39341.1 asparaginase domain-containing protein [Moraxella nasibovis]
MNTATHIIYAGGTFGSHGTPLSPLPADEFLPILQTQFHAKLPHLTTQILPNHLIKDSSTLTPSDFVHLYGLILQAYADGKRKFVLITGTDSLSFLAAFLANALNGLSDLSLVITGSMQPLFVSDNPIYTINEQSDAWANLSDSVIAASTRTGVFVQFAHKLMNASDTQKLNSQDFDAFVGTLADELADELADDVQTDQAVFNDNALDDKLAQLPTIIANAKRTQITAVYCLPNDVTNIEHQLAHLSDDTKAVILIGFGAGNLPSSQGLIDILSDLSHKKLPVICTTMCAFGGTNADYAAGAWQYQYGVQSSTLGIAGTYGQTLWQVLQ